MTYTSEVLADNPLVLLKLDEVSGTTAIDSGSRAIDGTHSGVTVNQAGHGSEITVAASYDGTDDYTEIPDAVDLQITGDLTLEALVYPTSRANFRMLWTKAAAGTGEYQWYLNNTTGIPYFYDTNDPTATPGTIAPPLNMWSHIAVKRVGRVCTHYLNGVPNGSRTMAGAAPATTTNPLRLGRRSEANYIWAGRIAMTAVYASGLSDARMLAHSDAFWATVAISARVTHVPLEAVIEPSPNARVSHAPLEAVVMIRADVRITQVAIEAVIELAPVASYSPRMRVIVAG